MLLSDFFTRSLMTVTYRIARNITSVQQAGDYSIYWTSSKSSEPGFVFISIFWKFFSAREHYRAHSARGDLPCVHKKVSVFHMSLLSLRIVSPHTKLIGFFLSHININMDIYTYVCVWVCVSVCKCVSVYFLGAVFALVVFVGKWMSWRKRKGRWGGEVGRLFVCFLLVCVNFFCCCCLLCFLFSVWIDTGNSCQFLVSPVAQKVNEWIVSLGSPSFCFQLASMLRLINSIDFKSGSFFCLLWFVFNSLLLKGVGILPPLCPLSITPFSRPADLNAASDFRFESWWRHGDLNCVFTCRYWSIIVH